jgi:CDP-diacylglycerol---glycerol-3-phosphate 3-phosphatidyltransferase
MVFMLQSSFRDPVVKIIEPFAKFLIRIGISANLLSTIGAVGASIAALYFFSSGQFLTGVFVVAGFVLFDLFDGTVARLSKKGTSKWGALLDSTLDRISDSAILLGGLIYFSVDDENLRLIFIAAIISSFLVSYIKARAEALQIPCEGGLAERAERTILILTAYGLYGLGVDSAVVIGIYIFTLISIITVFQRLWIVYQGSK